MMKKMKACMLHVLAGFALTLIFVGGCKPIAAGGSGNENYPVISSYTFDHAYDCECRSNGLSYGQFSAVLPDTVHKYTLMHYAISDDGVSALAEPDVDIVNVEDIYVPTDLRPVRLVKAEGASAWVNVGKSGDTFLNSFQYFQMRAVFTDEEGDLACTQWWQYYRCEDIFVVPDTVNQISQILLPGETKQLKVTALHYTPEHPLGEELDISQYAKWSIDENGIQNKGAVTLSESGLATANKTGALRFEVSFDKEGLKKAYPTWAMGSLYDLRERIYVLRNTDVLTEYSKVMLPKDEYVYAYFKADGTQQYEGYAKIDRWNCQGNFFFMDMDSYGDSSWGFRPVYHYEDLVPGKTYLLHMKGEIGDAVYTVEKEDGHEYLPGVVTRPPTNKVSGVMKYTCKHCGWTKTEPIPKTTGTGTVSPSSDSLEFETSDGIYRVLDTDSQNASVSFQAPKGNASSVRIPDTVTSGGITYKVVRIAENAFKQNSRLTKVSVGKYVQFIGTNAFYGCKNLKTVSGGKGIQTIHINAFAKCKKLTQVGSRKNTVTLPSAAAIGAGSFSGCTSIQKVTVSSPDLTGIGESAFRGCKALREFSAASKQLTVIGSKAFFGDKKLGAVTFKTTKLTKESVGANAFKGIKKTCKFKVPGAKVRAYKKVFAMKGAGKKISVKK